MGVALCGRAGSGKSHIARELVTSGACPGGVVSLTTALKNDLAVLGVSKGQPFARDMMIAYGQNRRAIDVDYWIKRLGESLHEDWGRGIVCDDLRFPNELAHFRGLGFLIVRVVTSRDVRGDRLGIPRWDDSFLTTTDESESAQERFGDMLEVSGTSGLAVKAIRSVLERG
jgi:RecA/RadA recombinase